jgi:hypothetical protein
MKFSSSLLLGFVLLSAVAAAQNFEVPANLPATKDEFVKSEPDFINAAKWLESIPLGTQEDKTKKMNAWVVAWITNSPTVTVEIRSFVTKLYDKNTQLLIVFMAGYSRYCLENNYSTDQLKANTAGVKSAINCYNLGGDAKKNKTLTAAIDADKEGKLEDWVREVMKGK